MGVWEGAGGEGERRRGGGLRPTQRMLLGGPGKTHDVQASKKTESIPLAGDLV